MRYLRVAIIVLLLGVAVHGHVSASTDGSRWMTAPLYVSQSNSTPYHQEGCHYELVDTVSEVAGTTMYGGTWACLVDGGRLSTAYGSVYLGNDEWYTGITAIKRPDVGRYVRLTDTGESVEFAIYASESDTLIQLLHRASTTVLRITPHVSEKLVPGRIDPVYGVVSYGFDYSASQEYTFSTSQLFNVNNETISADGRYVFVDMAEKVVGADGNIYLKQTLTRKIDIESHTIEEFTLPSALTGNHILAVSPSGRYLVSARSIIDTNDCHSNDVGYRTCRARSYAAALDAATGLNAPNSLNAENPVSVRFSEGETNITLEPGDPYNYQVPLGRFYKISLVPQLSYLALGDSYSSGEGDIAERPDGSSYYLDGTGGEGGCHISSRSYPFLLKEKLDNITNMKSVACSGARVDPDFYGVGRYSGQDGQYGKSTADELAMKSRESLQDFTPGQIRQLEFVKEYRPKMVTFTGGGNDVGFADILDYCASSYRLADKVPINETCAYVYDKQLRASLNQIIDTQYVFNKKFIEEVKRISPETKIYIVGYPQFIKGDASTCFRGSPLLNNDEIKFIRDSVVRLNNVLKHVAYATDIYYIDIEDSLEGGQICQGSEYMTGPTRVIINNNLDFNQNQNMYHPNAEGHKKIAARIVEQIKHYPGYDIVDVPAVDDATRVVRQAVLPSYVGTGSTQTVTLEPGTVKADGTTSHDVYSEKIHLGDFETDSTGALHVQITIPKSLGIGKHLYTISGLDANDEPVQIQQFIYITGQDPNDIDDDGIINAEDNCFAITEWYEKGVNICAAQKIAPPSQGFKETSSKAASRFLANENTTLLSFRDSASGKVNLTSGSKVSEKIANANNTMRPTNHWLIALVVAILFIGIGLLIYEQRKTN